MIVAEKISRRFGAAAVLHDVSFTANKGEVVGLLGPNGAGKTTTLRIVTGLLRPSSGTVSVDGIRMDLDPRAAKKRIGYLPENNPLYLDMQVKAYLEFVAEAKGIPKEKRRLGLDKTLEDCGLSGFENRTLGKLSKGYRQRVGIAQAVLNDPAVIVLDEPTSGLDPGQIVEFRELLKRLKRDRTILLSTHILNDVAAVCERLLILRGGLVIADDTVEALRTRLHPASEWTLTVRGPRDRVTSAFNRQRGLLRLRIEAGKEENHWVVTAVTADEKDPRRDFLKTILAYDLGLSELHPVKANIEDIFIELTSREKE